MNDIHQPTSAANDPVAQPWFLGKPYVPPAVGSPAPLMAEWSAYCTDFAQRSVLFLDVLRQRGNATLEASKREAPHVLTFEAELILDGRTLPRPVNYGLVRINPPEGVTIDPAKRPFIVFDPRAGHGPGIGGMKKDSEIGAALKAGNPCYFVGFLPSPVPGQTIEDVCVAEAEFVRTVAKLHPDAPSAPALIANCQAGWQVMMMAALNPELTGPILIAGSPLSYWDGNRGQAPLRYLGGMLGGTWLTALAGDMGGGIFDGASLIANFETMNPANTYFRKSYAVFDHVDTEAKRYLGFEQWWGSPVLLNAEEMQWIADNLFVGNRLAAGQIHTSEGVRIDLRNIRSPIVVFCSWGDDITPPPQALGWICDIYDHERDIVDAGQTIVYCVHDTIGHLGIFVSGKVGTKEHDQFAGCMDMIDLMPPGLYEAVIEKVDTDTAKPDLIYGEYLFRLEARSVEDIRTLGQNSPQDDLRFATVARVSDINNGLYRTFMQPVVRAMVTPTMAEASRQIDPHRLRYRMFSDENPMTRGIGPLAKTVAEHRAPVSDENVYRKMEHATTDLIETTIKTYGNMFDAWKEVTFNLVYGAPLLQAAVGMLGTNAIPYQALGRSVMREAAAAKLQLDLANQLNVGGPVEALLRSVNYIHRAERMVDERAFAELARYRNQIRGNETLTFEEFKKALRTQALIVGRNPEASLAALPALLPRDYEARAWLLDAIRNVAGVGGELTGPTAERLERIVAIFAAAGQTVDEAQATAG
jgi:hypothetical protein